MKAKTKKRQQRFKGIGRHAAALGVTREHLWQVLTARRESRSLLKRYAALTVQEKVS